MKVSKQFLYVGVLWVAGILTISCGEDRTHEYNERTEVTKWIYNQMKDWYYWEETMPSEESANFLANAENFFKSILSGSDKYSYIESTIEEGDAGTRSIAYRDDSYGFDFAQLSFRTGSRNRLAALVLYVAPDSPASEAGLKRGDLIITIQGVNVVSTNFALLYKGDGMQIGLGVYDEEVVDLIPTGVVLNLTPSRPVEDNPVFYSQTYVQPDGKSIGYLVYNHFTGGPEDSSFGNYNDQLLQLAQHFAQSHVDEFILDLRYNNGGYVYCAQLLSTILAPASALSEPLAYMEYNENHPDLTGYTQFINDVALQGANLNLKKLYVITGNTTASASEMVINCLKPYMEVILIGQSTEGKNVGSITLIDNTEEFPWILHPIVCRIYNSKMESNYSNGFTPDYVVDEYSIENLPVFKELGDEEELLLKTTLSIINGTYNPDEEEEEEATRSLSARLNYMSSSIEHRATPVLIK